MVWRSNHIPHVYVYEDEINHLFPKHNADLSNVARQGKWSRTVKDSI